MGNTESSSSGTANVLSGLKQAQEAKNSKLYQLVDYKGGGELVPWMKFGLSSGDFNIFDSLLEIKVAPFLYGGGKGKLVPISDLVQIRNKERNAALGALRRKKGKGKSGPNIFEGVNQAEMQGDMMKGKKYANYRRSNRS
jgi:transient receptor potential cation channel subfamily V member 5